MKGRFLVTLTGVLALGLIATYLISCSKNTEVIKVGAVLPLSGEAAAYGKSAQNAISLAVDETNGSGGIRGIRVATVVEDDQGTPRVGVTAINKLIASDKVTIVIGGIPSSVTLAMAPIAESRKVVLLSPTSSAPAITNAGDYIFRTAPSDIYQGTVMAERALDSLQVRSIAVLYINNDYGTGLKEAFGAEYRKRGGVILLEEGYDASTTDFRTLANKVKAASPDGIYLIAQKEAGLLLRNISEAGVTSARVLSTVLFEDPEVLAAAGKAAEGVIYTFPAFDPSDPSPKVQAFRMAYLNRFSVEPDIFAALSYDATNIVIEVMRAKGTTSDQIKEGLYGVRGYNGVAGVTSFDGNGDVVQTVHLKTVRNGKFVPLQ